MMRPGRKRTKEEEEEKADFKSLFNPIF